MTDLSAYEIEREANIARNRALLEELGLKDTSTSLGLPPKHTPKAKAKPGQPAKRPKREHVEQAPRRLSARLRKEVIDPHETPTQRRKREAEAKKRKREEEEERIAAEERAKLAKRPRAHELDLAVLTEAAELGDTELGDLRGIFQAITNVPVTRRIGDVRDWVFERSNQEERELEMLRSKLGKMKIVSRAKVTDNRIYSSAYHPEPSKDLVFVGDKHGQLGIWDARATPDEVTDEDGNVLPPSDKEMGKCWRLQQHWPATSQSSISCIKFDPIDAHSVFTTSYDCTIRRLSFVSSVSHQIFSSGDTLITSIDLPPSGHEMWISDTSGTLTHYDLREGEKHTRRYQVSDNKIGSVSVNPTSPHLLITASNNRFVRLWDSRKLQTIALGTESSGLVDHDYDYETVQTFMGSTQGRGLMRAEFQHGKSATSAQWDPRGRSIVSTSYDDSVNLWELDAAKYDSLPVFPSFKPFSRIRHNCQTGKWLTLLRAVWNPNPDVYPHFTIANMQHSLDIFSCKGDLVARLSDRERISAVQAVTCSHPNIVERCATGNASGRCVLWAPPNA
ncbi:WD40-repeat-containing domain protein [Pisolithus thermaeus]|nr:WD40-repeat-containing domain protein [Pisolithus croceorrhizus]KAI6160058.1 WD40-repeat-containing domain protein [Pisolithus thermaeus]